MANLSKQDIKELSSVGITGITDIEEARQIIIEKLANEHDTPGMEDEPLDVLIDILKACVNDSNEDEEEGEDELPEEDDEDELPEDEDEEDEDEEEDEEEDEDEDELMAQAAEEAKEAKKAANEKKEQAKKAKEAEASLKQAKQPAKRKSNRLDPQNNEEDRKPFEYFREFFPELMYEFAWVKNAGVSIKYKGENASRGVLLIEAALRKEDGTITCNCYFNTMTKNVEEFEKANYEFKRSWNNVPFLSKVTFPEVLEALNTFKKFIKDKAQATDKKLGENRQKMEDDLNAEKKATKKSSKKAAEKEEAPAEKAAPKKKAKTKK